MNRSATPAPRHARRARGVALALALALARLGGVSPLRADEPDPAVYLARPVRALTFTAGQLTDLTEPAIEPGEPTSRPADLWMPGQVDIVPWIEGGGEVYLDRPSDPADGPFLPGFDELRPDDQVVIRLPAPRARVVGGLAAPKPGRRVTGGEPVRLAFTLDGSKSDDGAAQRFRQAKVQHYTRLLMRGGPGAGWYGHQIRASNGGPTPPILAGFLTRRGPDDTYALVSGGRALSENLQLDRTLIERPAGPGPGAVAPPVPLATIPGITVAEIDWKSRLAGKTPTLDPLARWIPADQHALFVPSLQAAGTLLTLGGRWGGLPVIALAAETSGDQGVIARYERQLGLARADLAKLAGGGPPVRSLALTGSDPYFADGTDLALLFETDQAEALLGWFRERIAALPDAGAIDGTLAGEIRWFGKRSDQGRVRVYAAALEDVVVVTNSLPQLIRIAEAARGATPTLADAPEYRFFRDCYARGEADESALLVLTDATIRRWCGPRWRIGQSRRLRAAAALTETQAAALDAVVRQTGRPGTLTPPESAVELGDLTWGPAGVGSSVYGTLEFLTPIAELPLDTATAAEAEAYGRWRDGYQTNWRGVFDPIAVRIGQQADTLKADLTVMPLIVGTAYREFIEVVGTARITQGAGDPHPEALVQAVLALDPKSQLLRRGDQAFRQMTQAPARVGLSWIGPTLSLAFDEDPFWADLAGASDLNRFLTREWPRLPVGVHIDARDPVTMALFLGGVRAFAQQSAPGTLTWTTVPRGETSYVRVAAAPGAAPTPTPLSLYYATTPRGLMLTLSEPMVQRFLDRQTAPPPEAAGTEWLGESLAVRARREGLERIGRLGRSSLRERLRAQAWQNLAILNEWHRLYPDRDPVAVHEAAWGMRLVCPGGGQYVWNDRWHTMESTAHGHPGDPKPGPELPDVLQGLSAARFGLTFGDGGLRGRVELEATPAAAAP